jgi:4-hydroxy-3-methylbut-2-enyl diphosphate reductase
LGIVSQTTQPPARVARLVEAIRETYPEAEVRWIDTVCAPTRERQEAVRRLAREVEAVVVVGGRNSNNTGELARTCEAEGAAVIRVEHASELRPHWFMGLRHVGVTAGTSTPDSVVDEVRGWLEALEPAGAEVSLAC